jgi:phenylalanyl-tRNA synthetase beta chain
VAGHLSADQRLRRLVEDVLVGAGFSEAYTWSLVADDPHPAAIRLPAPLTSEQAVLRTTLLNGLVEAARLNVDAGNEPIALFELARVYLPGSEQLPDERWRVGGIVEGGFARAKAAVETVYAALHLDLRTRRAVLPQLHPGKGAELDAGWVGELHPELLEGVWGVFELDLTTLFEPIPERVEYVDVISFPALQQDIAVTVAEEVEAGALQDAILAAGGEDLREARVFDVYRGEQVGDGRKSIALHLVFQSSGRTLSDQDVAAARAEIVAALGEQFEAELRA